MTTQGQTLEYVADLTAELAKLTMDAGQPFLAYLLGLAQTEAARQAAGEEQDVRVRGNVRTVERSMSGL